MNEKIMITEELWTNSFAEESDLVDDGFDDISAIYIKEVKKYPLLTPEEEQLLSKKVREGTPAEAKAAADRLAVSNLALVINVARRFTGKGLPFLDLVQEGNLGLLTAVRKYDYTLGFRFSTYAMWWIKVAMIRGLKSTGRIVRLPAYLYEKMRVVSRARNEVYVLYEREATHYEISELTGFTVESICKLDVVFKGTISLDMPIGIDSEDTLISFIKDHAVISPEDAFDEKELKMRICKAFLLLTPRQEAVIRLRFGFDDGVPKTLVEVGEILGVSRESVRQQEVAALSILKNANILAMQS